MRRCEKCTPFLKTGRSQSEPLTALSSPSVGTPVTAPLSPPPPTPSPEVAVRGDCRVNHGTVDVVVPQAPPRQYHLHLACPLVQHRGHKQRGACGSTGRQMAAEGRHKGQVRGRISVIRGRGSSQGAAEGAPCQLHTSHANVCSCWLHCTAVKLPRAASALRPPC